MTSITSMLCLARGRPSRRTALSVPLLLLATLLCCGAFTAHAAIYTTAISLLNTPAVSVSSTGSAVAGLNQACVNSANLTATADNRAALSIRTDDMSLYVTSTVGTGTFYVAGFYDPTADAWFWGDGVSGTVTLFGRGPTCEAVNNVMASNWAPGYPKLGNSTGVGSLRYVVYDGTVLGWKNVDGTLSYDGAICECKDKLAVAKKKFPWWAILIIVLGCVAIIAIVVVIVVCCCCKKKKNNDYLDDESSSSSDDDGSASSRSVRVSSRQAKGKTNRYTREDDDLSNLSSRASSFRSNAARRTGPTYVRSHSGHSFNSRATSVSGKSRLSDLGSCSSDSYSYSYSGSDSSYTESTSSSCSSTNSDTSSSSSSAASSSRRSRSASSRRSGRSGSSSSRSASRSARRH